MKDLVNLQPMCAELLQAIHTARSSKSLDPLSLTLGSNVPRRLRERLEALFAADAEGSARLIDYSSAILNTRVAEREGLLDIYCLERFSGRFETSDPQLPTYETQTERVFVITVRPSGAPGGYVVVDVEVQDFSDIESSRSTRELAGSPGEMDSRDSLGRSQLWPWNGAQAAAYSDQYALVPNPSYRQ